MAYPEDYEREQLEGEERSPEQGFTEVLQGLIDAVSYMDDEQLAELGIDEARVLKGAWVDTYEEAGILTFNESGLVVRTEPNRHVSIRSSEGKELLLIADLAALPEQLREAIERTLTANSFIPQITRVHKVDTRFGFQEWAVDTDRGPVLIGRGRR